MSALSLNKIPIEANIYCITKRRFFKKIYNKSPKNRLFSGFVFH